METQGGSKKLENTQFCASLTWMLFKYKIYKQYELKNCKNKTLRKPVK